LLEEEEVVPSPDMLTTDEVATETFAELLARFRSCDGIAIPSESEQFRRIARFVDRRLGDSALRPGMIADELSLSIRQVQRIFAPFGLTPSQYIYKRRVNLAAHILRSGPSRSSVTELAMELGFSDTAHMCRLFRRQIGTSPMRYAAMPSQL
jgi:AraC family transcriptional activator of tynA and feaB